ncbi:hypothetical protein [Nitrospira sp. KM1]|uniref:hypothetical protein n=1 Tax=Nitrospira sp. KM1 TaxID=1936990 RepID=UPI001565B7B2|nr:hypothetical protein [Nitrospira sp. KM1]
MKNVPSVFVLLSALVIVLTLVNHLSAGNHIGMYGIGLRATFLPLVYMLLCARYVSAVENGYDRIFFCVNAWILIIGSMAILQVLLGKDHPINSVWGTSALGVGDFATTEKGLLIRGMFRPTSIFTHTGKFGQVIFTLVFFKWCYLLFSRVKRSSLLYALMLFDLAVIFVSGQRAALMFLVLGTIMINVIHMREHGVSLRKIVIPSVLIAGGLMGAWVARPGMAQAVFDRFASVITAVPVRLEGNVWLPIETMLEDYLFTGEGLGYFTFGSRLFGGGAQVYQAVKMEGLGESSFIRLSAEVGVVVALTLVVAYFSLVLRGIGMFMKYQGTVVASGSLFFSIWAMCLMLWSNTADVFANSIVTTMGFALSGATVCRVQPDNEDEVPEISPPPSPLHPPWVASI